MKKSPKEYKNLFRGKFLEDIVKITLKKSKKGAIMAKGSGTPIPPPEYEVTLQNSLISTSLDYNIFIKFLQDDYNIFGVKLQAKFEEHIVDYTTS